MERGKTVDSFLRKAQKSDSYVAEQLKIEFSLALESRRREVGLSYADLARLIDSSPAYITKIFRGDTNLTIETMVKLARATGGSLDLKIVDVPLKTVVRKAKVSSRSIARAPIKKKSPITVVPKRAAPPSPSRLRRIAERN
ncbi:MAG: helix-turn-helix domain-containing protein [Betaproteobacteria bacterium]